MADKTTSCTIERYVPLVDFLGAFLGEDCEVVLHDVRNPDNSVLAIANNHISGRRKGAPLTDLQGGGMEGTALRHGLQDAES
ncbi:hypothetical protein DDE01_20450 [Desulfovibrio desulfuricans]|nr:hypothetical protein DDE01_20450 [Desulfovibrio desulfuricans]